MHRHLEDHDNRGRRHNIRIRGLTETVEPSNIQQCIQAIFNGLLECMYKALHPRGRDSDPPRNVICCLVSFPSKEDILKKARERRQVLNEGAEIKLFQDLSPIALPHQKDLHPILDLLRSRNISYR